VNISLTKNLRMKVLLKNGGEKILLAFGIVITHDCR
jgi:hypothetical protein